MGILITRVEPTKGMLETAACLPLVADQVSPAVTLAAMARQVFSLLPAHHPSVGAHRRPERVGSAFSHHLVQSPNGTEAPSVGSSPPGPRTDFASPSTDGLQGLRGASAGHCPVAVSGDVPGDEARFDKNCAVVGPDLVDE